jgi:S1-C subfamily serine protease
VGSTGQMLDEAAAGTGMVINADGPVLTNNHVVDEPTITVSNEGDPAASGTLDGMIQANADTCPATQAARFWG